MCVKLKVNVQTEILSFENDSAAYNLSGSKAFDAFLMYKSSFNVDLKFPLVWS